LGQKPSIVVDVGHNPHAARWLAGRLASVRKPGQQIHAVYAALGDKDVEGVLRAMQPVVDHWWLAGLSVHRGLGVEELTERAEHAGIVVHARHTTVAEALDAVRNEAESADLIIVFGSFYTVAAARQQLVVMAS